jgi:hypothetical protein
MFNNNQKEQSNLEIKPQKEIISEQKTTNNLERISKDTYFTLSSTQFEKLKSISETIFKLTNKVLLDIIQQKIVAETWIEVRYGTVKPL